MVCLMQKPNVSRLRMILFYVIFCFDIFILLVYCIFFSHFIVGIPSSFVLFYFLFHFLFLFISITFFLYQFFFLFHVFTCKLSFLPFVPKINSFITFMEPSVFILYQCVLCFILLICTFDIFFLINIHFTLEIFCLFYLYFHLFYLLLLFSPFLLFSYFTFFYFSTKLLHFILLYYLQSRL